MLEQEILQASAKFIHKLMSQDEKISIHEYIGRPSRSTSKMFHRNLKKKNYKTAFEHHLCLYNQITSSIKYLKPKTFAAKLKKVDHKYTPPEKIT